MHLNPLETLEEEASSPEYLHPSIKALDMLNHSIGKKKSFVLTFLYNIYGNIFLYDELLPK